MNASIFIKIGEKLQKNRKSQKIKVGGNWEELWPNFFFSGNWQTQVKNLEKIKKKKTLRLDKIRETFYCTNFYVRFDCYWERLIYGGETRH